MIVSPDLLHTESLPADVYMHNVPVYAQETVIALLDFQLSENTKKETESSFGGTIILRTLVNESGYEPRAIDKLEARLVKEMKVVGIQVDVLHPDADPLSYRIFSRDQEIDVYCNEDKTICVPPTYKLLDNGSEQSLWGGLLLAAEPFVSYASAD